MKAWVESAGYVFGLVLFLLLVAGGVIALNHYAPDAEPHEWTMPARFEAQGAFTLGCALWDVPKITPYSDENPNDGLALVQFGPDPTGRRSILAIIDGPRGTSIISGLDCALSVDWSAFPKAERPVP